MQSINLCGMSVEDVNALRLRCARHLETWFGFSDEAMARRTADFEALTRWRLEGQSEPCCECGEDYPRADLHFHREIYCRKCRKKAESRD